TCKKCPSGDYNNSKCPCTNVTLFLMGSEAHDAKGNEIQPPHLFQHANEGLRVGDRVAQQFPIDTAIVSARRQHQPPHR
ncbi:hypothetical protein MK163_17480, partial [bacterium]|nr:hypothetical protein [bacterium]